MKEMLAEIFADKKIDEKEIAQLLTWIVGAILDYVKGIEGYNA